MASIVGSLCSYLALPDTEISARCTGTQLLSVECFVHIANSQRSNLNWHDLRHIDLKPLKRICLKLDAFEKPSLVKNETFKISHVVSVLKKCRVLEEGKQIHEYIVHNGLENSIFLGNLVIQMYGRCGALKDARDVFQKMETRDASTWTLMIALHAQHGQLSDALYLLQRMPQQNVVAWNAMVTGYAQHGQLDSAVQVFQGMPHRNIISWNVIIAGYAQHGLFREATELFQQMPERDVVTWTSLISGYAQHGHLPEAFYLFNQMPRRNVVSWTVMVSAYARQGHLETALRLFQQMPQRDLVSWNALVSAYAQQGNSIETLQLFLQMQIEGFTPNKITFLSMLDACANGSSLADGKQIHAHGIVQKFDSDVMVGTALINMYGICGHLKGALLAFDRIDKRNVVSWNAMIAVYAWHGHGIKAFQLVPKMKFEHVMPDEVTFASILSACRHAGLLNEGCHCLVSMSCDDNIRHSIEHFTAILEILGHSGNLEEAEGLINNLLIPPDAACWRLLLSSCTIFSDVQRGIRAKEHGCKIDPDNAALYVSLSNIYAGIEVQ